MGYIIRNGSVGLSVNAYSENHIAVTADMTATAWKTAASHEVFTVTGLVRACMWIECEATLTDAAGAADIQFGVEGATAGIIAATGAAGKGGSTIGIGELWYDTTPTVLWDLEDNVIMRYFISGLDIGYEITGAALTGGSLVFHCVWEPMNSIGSVSAGTGVPL